MFSFLHLLSVGLAGSVAAAGAVSIAPRQASGQNVVYWGQNGGGTIENNDLAAYCTSSAGIDVLVLAFLYQYGNGGNIPSGTIGQSCYISTAGQGQNCEALTSAIKTCKDAGVKIILSLGGATSSYSLQSQAQAEQISQYLWDSYGNSGNTTVQRPFGSNFVDGFDFDIEVNRGSEYYRYMIAKLRDNFATDPQNSYYITGAPQCPIPEPNMGEIISTSKFDYIFVQFYNNNNYTVPCALPINGNAPFNYNNWTAFISDTPSADAKIFIGVPASPLAANGSPGGATYYATPEQLAGIINDYKSDAHFGGIMMWSAGFSDANVNDGCTYAQEAKSILLTGSPCGSSGPPPSSGTTTTALPPSATTSTPASTQTKVAQWGQCGGNGYKGSTECAPPYTCIKQSEWWSSCH
ncbi:Chitinase 2 [Lecanicillium sp. MT-2017a]|nr:Chitinase 2 [Lecanicillium sp. MT-2017a]